MTVVARRIRLDLAYDGTGFDGWQVQPGRRTVQGVVEAALGRIHGGRPIRVRGAGRTDAGVHARGQVADADVLSRLEDSRLLAALASLLPDDVRPLALVTVDAAFDARRDAVSKTYRYLLDRTPHGDPLVARFALHAPSPIDRPAVDDALRRLIGRHDWSGFAGAACTQDDRIRILFEATMADVAPGRCALTFSADGFLNHMVRNLVGTLLEIGRGRFAPGRVDEILASGDRRRAGPTAPARGLCLERIEYAAGREGSGRV